MSRCLQVIDVKPKPSLCSESHVFCLFMAVYWTYIRIAPWPYFNCKNNYRDSTSNARDYSKQQGEGGRQRVVTGFCTLSCTSHTFWTLKTCWRWQEGQWHQRHVLFALYLRKKWCVAGSTKTAFQTPSYILYQRFSPKMHWWRQRRYQNLFQSYQNNLLSLTFQYWASFLPLTFMSNLDWNMCMFCLYRFKKCWKNVL